MARLSGCRGDSFNKFNTPIVAFLIQHGPELFQYPKRGRSAPQLAPLSNYSAAAAAASAGQAGRDRRADIDLHGL